MKFNRILVTGAAGFLGSEIVRQADSAGFSLTLTDRALNSRFVKADFIAADILDPLSLSKIVEGVDCVCHVAGLAHVFDKPESLATQIHSVNVLGSQNVAHAALQGGVKHFVLISSVSVYGGAAHGKDEFSECHPEGPYAKSKWQAERCLIDLCQKEKMNLTVLRLATLYGEEDPGNVARLVRLIDRGRFIWIGKGDNYKSLLHREDAARACIIVLKSPISGINIYNVSAPAYAMCDVVAEISKALNKPLPSLHIPASFALTSSKVLKKISFSHGRLNAVHDTVQKWLANDYYNTDKFCSLFNFKAQVGLEEGIRREVAWYKGKYSA